MGTQVARRWDDVLAEELADPGFREQWQHSAPARAMANALVRFRADHSLTQSELARILGVRQPTVARWETGEHNPTWETMLLLAHKLGITISITAAPATAPIEIPAGESTRHGERLSDLRVDSIMTGTQARIVTRALVPDEARIVRV